MCVSPESFLSSHLMMTRPNLEQVDVGHSCALHLVQPWFIRRPLGVKVKIRPRTSCCLVARNPFHPQSTIVAMSHYNLVHKIIPTPQVMKILDAKAAVDKEWKKLETIPAWNLDNVKSKKEIILEAQRDKKKVHFATLMDTCHFEKCGVGTQIAEVQRQSRAPWRTL